MLENDKKEENLSFEELLNDSMKETKLGKTVTGTIIDINPQGEIFVDIGYKADGLIPKSEYSYDEKANPADELKAGDTITADVLKRNDGQGNVLLSYKKVQQRNAKKEFEQKVEAKDIFEEVVSEVNDSGLVVNYHGIRIFIPLSLSGLKRNEDGKDQIGNRIRFRVIEYEPKQRKIIGSVKDVMEEERNAILDHFWNQVEEGQSFEGTVTSISSYGAFVDVEGVQGLLHVTEMAWGRNIDPRDILEIGQKIQVMIKNLDTEHRRMLLSYQDKGPNPWECVAGKYAIGDVVGVSVVKMMPYGAFVELEPGIEGLIHISQICEDKIARPEDRLQLNQKVNAKIIAFDHQNQKMELSIRDLEGTSDEFIEKIGE